MPRYSTGTVNGDTIAVENTLYEGHQWLSIFLDGEWKMDLPCASVETVVKLLRLAKKGK